VAHRRRLTILAFSIRASIIVAAGCTGGRGGGTSPSTVASNGSSAASASASADPDVCDGSPPVAHAFVGLAKTARCDQDVYYRMAKVADALGVSCGHCHAPDPKDPNNQKWKDFPAPTHEKDVANWMGTALMASLKPADGSAFTCASCHTDEQGKPVAKILGEPRDEKRTLRFMSQVLVKKFVDRQGNKLQCTTCHVGPLQSPEFVKDIILHTERLPPHSP